MAGNGADLSASERRRLPGLGAPVDENGQRSELLSADELLFRKIPSRRVGGYDRDAVDALLGRAAQTIDSLAHTRKQLVSELEASRSATNVPLLNETVAQMLMKAQELMDEEKELAHRAAATLVAEAQAEADQAARLRLEAQSELEAARAEADAILVSARGERERLMVTFTRDADDARMAAEEERERIEAAIARRREEWTNKLQEALTRLDTADLRNAFSGNGNRAEEQGSSELRPVDLAAELSDRAGGASGPRTAHPDASDTGLA
jgi:DivIVA protein